MLHGFGVVQSIFDHHACGGGDGGDVLTEGERAEARRARERDLL